MPSFTTLQQYFKEVIYGGIDGIVTTFAVVAGFSGAALASDTTVQLSFAVVLLFGLANLFADATSMGLGNFLSVRSEQDMYEVTRQREHLKLKEDGGIVEEATVTILMEHGFSSKDAHKVATLYRHNESYWLDFLMQHGQKLPDPRGVVPVYTGLATFLAFLSFGAIPLLPFILYEGGSPTFLFELSIAGTLLALLVLGLLKWWVIGAQLVSSLVEVFLVGSTAALIAYTVGRMVGI